MSGQLYALAALFLRKEFTIAVGYEAGWASEPVWTSYPVGNRLVATDLPDSYQKQNAYSYSYMCIYFYLFVFVYLSVIDLFNDNFIFY
jgi:hypothetical protein